MHGNTVEVAGLSFKDETAVIYIRTQCVPRSKHSPPRLCETILLMLYKAKVAVCSEIYTEPIKTMWAPCTIFLSVQPGDT